MKRGNCFAKQRIIRSDNVGVRVKIEQQPDHLYTLCLPAAACSGIPPFLYRLSGLAPSSRSRRAIAMSSHSAAAYRGVFPSRSEISGEAPRLRSKSAIESWRAYRDFERDLRIKLRRSVI